MGLFFLELGSKVSPHPHLVIFWNIEGVNRGFPSLVTFVSLHKPWLIFLSKPQAYNCDIHLHTIQLPSYNFFLNSHDCYLSDLPMETM